MEQLLAGCQNVINYIDDIIVCGSNSNHHVASKCNRGFENVRSSLNASKCIFKASEVIFLGHHLSTKGVKPSPEKIAALSKFRSPQTKEDLMSFLDLVDNVAKFVPDLGTKTDKLRELTKDKTAFQWDSDYEESFQRLKETISDLTTLSYFDPSRLTRLVASPVALGAVLLTVTERRYYRAVPKVSHGYTF